MPIRGVANDPSPPPAVLGQDPLIPPQLLQAEIPAVWPCSFKPLVNIPRLFAPGLVGQNRLDRRKRSP